MKEAIKAVESLLFGFVIGTAIALCVLGAVLVYLVVSRS